MSGILGDAQMVRADNSAPLKRDGVTSMARMILDCGRRLQRQIANYLFYAQLQLIPFDQALQHDRLDFPDALIRDTATEKATHLGRLEDLVLQIEDGIVLIAAGNLKKIVEELSDNAFKFSKPRTRVYITAELKKDTCAQRA